MTTATLPPYTIQPANRDHGRHLTGSADDIHSALNAAWQLNRHVEDAVEIIDNRDGTPRVVAVLTLEWKDGE